MRRTTFHIGVALLTYLVGFILALSFGDRPLGWGMAVTPAACSRPNTRRVQRGENITIIDRDGKVYQAQTRTFREDFA
jgi:hypothetical protein